MRLQIELVGDVRTQAQTVLTAVMKEAQHRFDRDNCAQCHELKHCGEEECLLHTADGKNAIIAGFALDVCRSLDEVSTEVTEAVIDWIDAKKLWTVNHDSLYSMLVAYKLERKITGWREFGRIADLWPWLLSNGVSEADLTEVGSTKLRAVVARLEQAKANNSPGDAISWIEQAKGESFHELRRHSYDRRCPVLEGTVYSVGSAKMLMIVTDEAGYEFLRRRLYNDITITPGDEVSFHAGIAAQIKHADMSTLQGEGQSPTTIEANNQV
jgi:hypothetical protein